MSEDGDSGVQHERTGETEPENNRDSDLLIRNGTTSGMMRGQTRNSIKLTPDSPPQVFEAIIGRLKNNPEYKDWAPTGEALLKEYFESGKKEANEDVQKALDKLNSIVQENMSGGTGMHHNQGGNYVRDINSDAEMNDDDHGDAADAGSSNDAGAGDSNDGDMYSIDIYAKKKKKIGYVGIRSMLREINTEMVSMEKEKKALVSFYEKKVADLEDTIFELRKDRASAEDGGQFWA